MAENLNLKTIDTVDTRPFKKLVMTIGELPTSFVESMTYYELLAWFVNYLETVIIPTVNNNAEAVQELQDLFVELRKFVDEYFDNLDVQDEIDNKLDRMAESGELGEIIKNYFENYNYLVFPHYKSLGTDTLGDCTIFKSKSKSVMVDCFSNTTETYEGIKEALDLNNITHLDYFIITHYHADHYGNTGNLINDGFIDKDTIVILPNEVHNDYINITGNDVKSLFYAANIPFELCDNQTFTFDDVTMELFNGSLNDINYLNAQGDRNYNDYSIVTKIITKDKRILLTGDLDGIGLRYVANNYLNDGPYDILKDCHHGFANFVQTFVNKTSPKYVVVPTTYGMIEHNLGYRGDLRAAWQTCTSNIYLQGEQPELLTFRINQCGIRINSNALSVQQPSTGYRHTYYVNANTTSEIRDGSTDNPFKDLSEAAVMMPKSSRVRLIVQSELTNTAHVTIQNFKSIRIDFANFKYSSDGIINFINNGYVAVENFKSDDTRLYFEENETIKINNFTSTKNNNQLYIFDSNVILEGDFTIDYNSTTNPALVFNNSHVAVNISSLTVTGTTTQPIIGGWRCSFVIPQSVASIIAAYNPLKIFAKNTLVSSTVTNNDIFNTVFESTAPNYTTGTLKVAPSDYYRKIVITYTNTDGYYYDITVPTNSRGNFPVYLETLSASTSGDREYRKSALLTIDSTNKTFTLSRQLSYSHVLTDNTIASRSTDPCIGIVKIVGIA